MSNTAEVGPQTKNAFGGAGPKFQIFLSHHESEADIAEGFQNAIRELCDGKAAVYTYKDSDSNEFRIEIEKKAPDADLLIFFYTAEHRDLSWVSMEIGLYRGARIALDETPNVFCFMSQDIESLPPILDNLERLPATVKNFDKFLTKLIHDGTYSDDNKLHSSDDKAASTKAKLKNIKEYSQSLASKFSKRLAVEFFTYRLGFQGIQCYTEIEAATNFKHATENWDTDYYSKRFVRRDGREVEGILDFQKVVIKGSDFSREIAGLPTAGAGNKGQLHWHELISAKRSLLEREIDFSLPAEIMNFCCDDKLYGRRTKILSPIRLDERVHWPVISRVEKRDGAPVNLFVIFVDDPTTLGIDEKDDPDIPGTDRPEIQEAFHRLLTMLNLARRFRTQIVDPTVYRLLSAVQQDLSTEKCDTIISDMWSSLESMEKEAMAHDLRTPENIPREFDREKWQRIFNMYAEFNVDRENFLSARKSQDYRKILEILEKWQVINREFMKIGLETYSGAYNNMENLSEKFPEWGVEFSHANIAKDV